MWSPSSWQNYQVKQQPVYSEDSKLQAVKAMLATKPPLVFAGEVVALKHDLAKVSRGEAFLLQGGDCAESFEHFSADNIRDSLRVILQMAAVLTYGLRKPVVKVARMAGQFAKPRSSDNETVGGITLPSYRGDMVNAIDFDAMARKPEPMRMLDVYHQSAATLNLMRAFTSGGLANLKKIHRLNLEFTNNTEQGDHYQEIAHQISDAIAFLEACGIDMENNPQIGCTNVYTSHEALLLHYEEALTREDSVSAQGFVNTSAHMVWIGDRTRDLDGAHVEYMRGIINPVGIKCGPSSNPDEIANIVEKINPNNEAGKIVLIARFGHDKVHQYLPQLIDKITATGLIVVWSCDPMHGNTVKSSTGYKTRDFNNIQQELKQFLAVHKKMGTVAGGIHLEMTGSSVTECTGGLQQISDEDLGQYYQTLCDPRLNANQSLELAFNLVAQ